jgi:PAS domain S-box-containing protein
MTARPLSLGRTFLLWLLGVLLLIFITVSALVLWHEQQVLTTELEVQGDLLARLLALSASNGGSPEYLAIFSLTDLTAGEVRDTGGGVLWRYGPPFAEVETLGGSQLRVDRRVELAAGPWGRNQAVEVTLLVSRARVQTNLAGAAVRLAIALFFALAVAMTVGLWIVDRVVQPLNELTELTRSFDPGEPLEMADSGPGTAELAELGAAFREMTRRLSEQQHSLATSEHRFRGLFASSPTPLLELDRDLSLRDANPAATDFLGVEPTEAVGRPLQDFVIGDSDGRPLTGFAGSFPVTGEGVVESRWRLPGGEFAEIELHLRRAGEGESEGYIAAIHDLTDRVRRLGQRWQQTFDAMIDGVALVDGDAGIEQANRALAPHLPVLSKELLERGAGEGSWRVWSIDRLLECNLSRPEGLRHAILVVRDVTEAVSAEARLREIEKMQAVATLASGVAHDFNNLLAAIQLHLRLIEAEPDKAAEAVDAIRDLSKQGSEVVGELLLFARSDDSVSPETFDLAALVSEQKGVLNHLLPDGVDLEIATKLGVIPVTGNPVALRRLILNLVVNARDAVAPAGGTISISVSRRGGRAVLEVADTGPGVAEEYRDRLFEPFFTLSRKGRGAGLGLAVVYAIASAHGGDVELASSAGEGARFVVRLPPGDMSEIECLGGKNKPAGGGGSRRRVLLVEADGRWAGGVLEGLAEAGYEVRHAPDTVAADRFVSSWSPHAVIVRTSDVDVIDWAAELEAKLVVLDAGGSSPSTATVVAELETVLAKPASS